MPTFTPLKARRIALFIAAMGRHTTGNTLPNNNRSAMQANTCRKVAATKFISTKFGATQLTHTLGSKFLQAAGVFAFALSGLSANAACDNTSGNITCTGVSDNSVPLTGTVTLDSSGGEVTLNNQSNVIISNDRGQDTPDRISTVQSSGGNNATVNNSGTIKVDRAAVFDSNGNETTPAVFIDSSLFGADANGQLNNNGAPVGIAAAISFGTTTPLITITNAIDTVSPVGAPRTFFGTISAAGNFSAAIYGNSAQVVINNQASISNNSYSSGDDFTSGHWSIATYGSGTTVINNGGGLHSEGSIIGDILLTDRDPFKQAAQTLASFQGNDLALAYAASEVGPRNSVINNASGSIIRGKIYLGSGEHVINNTGSMFGDILIDQRAAEITSVSGGVANVDSSIAGARKFTLVNSGFWGQFAGLIQINDVVGAENTFTFNLGVTDSTGAQTSQIYLGASITANGLGNNTLNLNCFFAGDGNGNCQVNNGSQITGMTTVNIGGTALDINEGTRIQATGDINLNSGTTRLMGSINGISELVATNINVNAGASLLGTIVPATSTANTDQDGIGTITGNLINRGLVNVGNATLLINGNAVFEDNSMFSINIKNATIAGKLDVVGGNGTFSSSSVINPSVDPRYYVRSGDTFTIASNTTGSPRIQDDNRLLHFTSSDSSGNLVLTAQQYISKSLNPTAAAENAVAALTQITGNSLGAFDQLRLNQLQLDLQNASSVELKRAGERLRPEINDSAIRMVLGNTDHALDIVQSHLFASTLGRMRGENLTDAWIRDTQAGDNPLTNAKGIWVQGFGYGGVQDTRKNTDGYSLNSTGFATGMDRTVGSNENLRLGAGFNYAAGNIDNSGITDSNRMRTNSYLGMLYGTWSQQNWFINGALATGRNTYSTRRTALGRIADGEHDAWQMTGKLDAGLLLPLNSAFTFIPMGALSYTHLNESGYTETGSTIRLTPIQSSTRLDTITTPGTPIALSVEGRSFDSLRSGLGGKLLWAIQQPSWHAAIDLHAMWQHEFGDLAQDSTARFVAGGNSFSSPGVKLARDTMVLGSTLRLTGDDEHDQVSLLASYDADIRDQYFGQTMSMMLRYDFDQAPSYLKRAQTRLAAKADAPAITVDANAQTLSDIQQAIAPAGNSPQALANHQTELAVTAGINQWLAALINKNTDLYLNSYASEFTPPNGMSRRVWENQRKVELARNGNPAIQVSYLTVTPNGNQASAIFTQAETLGKEKSTLVKSLDLIEKNGRWLIVKEDSMAVPD